MTRPTESLSQSNWVPETRFGVWFQGTSIWERYVLTESLNELQRLSQPLAYSAPVILDAGCGEGMAFAMLEERFKPQRIIGIDIDRALIGNARQAGQQVSAAVEILHGDICNSDLPAESVDMILCHQTLHHVSNQQQMLKEFRRLLRPNGVLLLNESCQAFTESLPIKMLFRHPRGNQKTAEQFLDLLTEAGFAVTSDCYSTPDPWWARPGMGMWQKLGFKPKHPAATQLCAAVRLSTAKS